LEQAQQENINPSLIFSQGILDNEAAAPAKTSALEEHKTGETKTLADGRKVQWDGKGWKVVR
jgi:hypothetical protein